MKTSPRMYYLASQLVDIAAALEKKIDKLRAEEGNGEMIKALTDAHDHICKSVKHIGEALLVYHKANIDQLTEGVINDKDQRQ